jgi:hypothetical protein
MNTPFGKNSGLTAAAVLLAGAVLTYDSWLRWWMRDWGSTPEERAKALPGDEVVEDVMSHHTKAITIQTPPEAVWPWLVQIGDRRAGFYSYDWIERATHSVHYIDGEHSARRIHPELQQVKVGDALNTGSYGDNFVVGAPITVVIPNHALVAGSWAFVLEPQSNGATRFLMRDRYAGWLRAFAPKHSGLLRLIGGGIDYLFGEPLHFFMERKMMLGLKERAEGGASAASPAAVVKEAVAQ